MPVDLYIQVPPDGSGKKIRAIQEINLSGDVVYSKVVKVSGEVVKISGEVVKISGESVVVTSGVVDAKISGETLVVASGPFVIAKSSGEIYIAKVSGENVVITSGTVSLVSGGFVRAVTSGDVVVIYSGTVRTASGSVVMTTSGSSAIVSGTVIAKVSGELVIAKVSGETVTTLPYSYGKAVVSGAVVVNVVSGTVALHTVVLNDGASGYSCRIRDSCSGIMGTIIAAPYLSTRPTVPATLIFDCTMTSGIVVDTSGAQWNITVTYRKPF